MRIIYDFLRPFYRPVFSALRRYLINEHTFIRHPDLAVPSPWDFVQLKIQRDLHRYLHTSPANIKNIVIVGANTADEIEVLEANYPGCFFTVFEPSVKYFPGLLRRYGHKANVKCIRKACGNFCGISRFFELPMAGNGSVLKPSAQWKVFNKQEDDTLTEHDVLMSTLDEELANVPVIDLLWIDVQGAEMMVLQGASKVLKRTRSVFLEVALCKNPYEGGAVMDQLDKLLNSTGHKLVLLGADSWNFTGNAAWIQDLDSLCLK